MKSILSLLQQEQVEWGDVNKLLQHHGFKPVYFADPVENKNLSGKSQLLQLFAKKLLLRSGLVAFLPQYFILIRVKFQFQILSRVALHVFLDLVLLEKKSAGEMRTTLRTMLTDSERRQALIQELIKSNNQLKLVK